MFIFEIKCQISMKKWINIFTFAYGQGRGEGANPTSNPPYRKYDRKISVFYAFPYESTKLLLNNGDQGDFGFINSFQVDVNVDESSPQ